MARAATSRFTSLRSRREHAHANRQVVRLFRDQDHRRAVVRLQEGRLPTLYLPAFDIWLAAHALPNRYRNAFGTGDPVGRANLWPSVQLNLALAPGSARPHARFLRDQDQQLWIAHTGTLGGRQVGISRDGFLAFVGQSRAVMIDGAPETVVLLGTFEQPTALVERIAHLTHAASAFRSALAAGLR
jgi:hypothetical protein